MKFPFTMKTLILITFTFSINSEPINQIKIEFLIGQYDYTKHPSFINLKTIGIPVAKDDLYLQKEVAEELLKLYQDLKKDIPDAEFYITSATRNYWHQKQIWEQKWKKYKPLYNNHQEKIVKKILEFSSMPGTSRHHWGTDFDINILNNEYYETAKGKKLYQWLKQNAKKYGFCMPYNEGRQEGYYLEKWHWSYFKLAKQYQKQWNEYFNKNYFDSYLDFTGKEFFKNFSYTYVNSINQECK